MCERVVEGGEVRYAELLGLLTEWRLRACGDADESAVVEPVDCVDVNPTNDAGRSDYCEANPVSGYGVTFVAHDAPSDEEEFGQQSG